MQTKSQGGVLELVNRHTGEALRLRKVRGEGGEVVLELEGGVPPKGEGPPLHTHLTQRETGTVTRGVLMAEVDGRRLTFREGETADFPAGVPHRWWNDADEPLEFQGRVTPAENLDSFLQAIFAIMNSAPKGRPPFFCLAHLLYRSRKTQRIDAVPAPVQAVVFPLVVALGTVLGKYRGDDWPGSPASCPGAPEP